MINFDLSKITPEKLEDITHSYFWSSSRRKGVSFEEYAQKILKAEMQNPYVYVPTEEYEEEIIKTYYEEDTCQKPKPKNISIRGIFKKLSRFRLK